jgi:hypothetical protein
MDDNEAWQAALGTLPELLGPGDLPKLNEGLRYLFEELREAQAAFIGVDHQHGVYSSLVAVSVFLGLFRAVHIEGLTVPLAALESALWALDEGVTEPLLKPARRATGGHPRASQLRQQFIGTVAYTVRSLCDFGYRLSKAQTEVAGDLKRIGVQTERGSNQITARTVRGWCAEVSEDVGRHSPAAQRYDALMADPRTAAYNHMPPETAAKILRQRLVHAARALGVASTARKPPNPSC